MDKGIVDYFMQVTKEKFDGVDERFDRVEIKLDQVMSFRWQIIGGAVGLSSLFAGVIAIATIYFLRTQ